MRTISSVLAAAQKSASRDPAISAIIRNDWEAVRRLDFTLLNDTFNAVGSHDIAVDGQGNVHRVRMEANAVKYQKLTPAQQPTDANWDSWTDLVTAQGTKVAVAARGPNVIVVYNSGGAGTSTTGTSAGGASSPRTVAIWFGRRPMSCSGVTWTRTSCVPCSSVTVLVSLSHVHTSPLKA